MMLQQPSSLYGYCERCGAPKAPLILPAGLNTIACTRCTTVEEQKTYLKAIEQIMKQQPDPLEKEK